MFNKVFVVVFFCGFYCGVCCSVCCGFCCSVCCGVCCGGCSLTDPVEPLPTEEALALPAQPHNLLAAGGKFHLGQSGSSLSW